jgi:hypothetical protein
MCTPGNPVLSHLWNVSGENVDRHALLLRAPQGTIIILYRIIIGGARSLKLLLIGSMSQTRLDRDMEESWDQVLRIIRGKLHFSQPMGSRATSSWRKSRSGPGVPSISINRTAGKHTAGIVDIRVVLHVYIRCHLIPEKSDHKRTETFHYVNQSDVYIRIHDADETAKGMGLQPGRRQTRFRSMRARGPEI